MWNHGQLSFSVMSSAITTVMENSLWAETGKILRDVNVLPQY